MIASKIFTCACWPRLTPTHSFCYSSVIMSPCCASVISSGFTSSFFSSCLSSVISLGSSPPHVSWCSAGLDLSSGSRITLNPPPILLIAMHCWLRDTTIHHVVMMVFLASSPHTPALHIASPRNAKFVDGRRSSTTSPGRPSKPPPPCRPSRPPPLCSRDRIHTLDVRTSNYHRGTPDPLLGGSSPP